MFPLYVRNEKSVLGIFRPLYILARIFGFLTFSVNLKEPFINNKLFISKTNLFLFVLQIALYLSYAFLNISINSQQYIILTPIMETGTRLVLIGGFLFGIGMVVGDLLNRKNVWRIFQKFYSFDREIRMVPISINYSLHSKYFGKYLMACALFYVIYITYSALILLQYIPVSSFAIIFSSYTLTNGVYTVVMSIYIFFLYNIRVRFTLLNENLQRLLSTHIRGNINVIKNTDDETICHLKTFADLHKKLNDVLEIANLCYGKQAMLCIGACFSFTVFALFGLYRIWNLGDVQSVPELQSATVLCAWAFYYNYFVICVLSSGSLIRNEGKYTGVVIHKHINRCNNPILIERLMTFSQQLVHRIPEATCKLFVFDWTVLFSLISATVTYLIILIQFDSSSLRSKVDSYHNAKRNDSLY